MKKLSRYFILVYLLQPLFAYAVEDNSIKIGVLAHRGEERAINMWSQTATYLSEKIPQYKFSIVPLTNDTIDRAVNAQDIDFVLTNPASYAALEAKFGVTRIATLRNKGSQGNYTRYGSVIFTRADRSDLNSIDDLHGKSFAAVHPNAFGGWWMAWMEMKRHSLDPISDLKRIDYFGFPQDAIVYAVQQGLSDAGTVRTNLLERLAARGKIELSDFKVLNQAENREFPYLHTSQLYPEWPFATGKNVSAKLAHRVAVALLSMESNSPAAISANIAGWTVPLDYQSVHNLMRALQVGLYKHNNKIKLQDVLNKYWRWITAGFILLLVMGGITIFVGRLNKKLAVSNSQLENEIIERRNAENESARLGRLLDNSSNEIYLIDPQSLCYIQVNKGAINNLGYSMDSMRKLTLLDIHPELDHQVVDQMFAPLRKGLQPRLTFKFRPVRKDGSWYHAEAWVQMSDLKGRPVYLAVYEDVTEKTRVEHALAIEKEKAQITLQSIGDAVITTDHDGIIEYLNPVAEKLTGWKANEVVGKHLEGVVQLRKELDESVLINPVTRCVEQGDFVEQDENTFIVGKNAKKSPVHVTVTSRIGKDNLVEGVVIVFRDVKELRELQKSMRHFASFDDLTNLMNRRVFQEQLEDALHNVDDNYQYVLMYLDLDQFKIINDTCGHIAGDDLLRQVATLLAHSVRESDLVARLGGDEFAVLLRRNCQVEDAKQVAKKIIDAVNNLRFVWQNQIFQIGVSVGIVHIDEHCSEISEVLAMADSACYVAKDSGRNRYYVYQPDDETLIKRQGEMQWMQRIKGAIDNDGLLLYIQPIVPLGANSDVLEYFEILVRMPTIDGAVISPSVFLPAAERYQLMPKLDLWVIENAFKFLSQYIVSNKSPVRISINLSGQSLVDEGLVGKIESAFSRYDITPSLVTFEITETATIANFHSAIAFINRLQILGCQFALDDFGSGMCSFSYLKNLPVNIIKIDGSFIKDALDDAGSLVTVKAISQIAKVMGKQIIAEWVEHESVKNKLVELGVEYGQGFALGKPNSISHYLPKYNNLDKAG